MVAGYRTGGTRRWQVKDGQKQGPTLEFPVPVQAITFSRDGRWMVTADSEDNVIVWNATTHKKVHKITERCGGVWGIDISRATVLTC